MKHTRTYTLLALALLTLAAACRQQQPDGNVSDSVRLELLDRGIDRNPDDAKLLASRAQLLFNLGRVKEAAYDINRSLQIDPDNLPNLLLKSDIFFANGNIEESFRSLEAAERIAPDNLDVILKLGEITFYGRDYDRSLRYLSSVTEREPNNRAALFMKGFIYIEKGDTANAVILLRQVTDKFPDYAPAFETLGVLYANRLNPLAAEYLGTALQLDPNNTNVIYNLAKYHQDLGNYETAESLYRQLLALNPNSADAWHNLGWIQMVHHGDNTLAAQYFDSALAIDPAMQNALTNRQLALEQTK